MNDHGALGRDTVWEAPIQEDMDEEESGSDEDENNLNPEESTPTVIPQTDLGSGEYTFVQVCCDK